jgi:hypothetical protein
MHAKRRACPPPWPPWTMATSLTCVFIIGAWGLRPGPAWSPPSLCAFVAQLSDLGSSWTWAAPHQGVRPLPGQKSMQWQVVAKWRRQPWHATSSNLATVVVPTPSQSHPPWPRSPWGTSWAYTPLVWACRPRSPQHDWPPSAHFWPSPWSTWAPPQTQPWLWQPRLPRAPQLVDRKVATSCERCNVLYGRLYLGQSRVNRWVINLEAHH